MRRKVNLRDSSASETRSKVETTKYTDYHQKIAANRGESWRKNMLKGRMEVSLNPTVLRLVRLERNQQQKDVANKLGLSLAVYGTIERGQRGVNRERVLQIAKLFGQNESKIFKKEKSKKYIAIKA